MPPSINKVTLLGNLGGDPEVRNTQAGKPVCTFSVATSEPAKDGREPATTWHRVVVWDRLAELCGQYLSKGRQVYVEGRIQHRQWEDRDGQKQTTTEIVAREVQFLGAHDRDGAQEPERHRAGRPGPRETRVERDEIPASGGHNFDDIPF